MKGWSQSRYIAVILSSNFLQKNFPKIELANALFVQTSTNEVKVLPILACAQEELAKEYPWLLNISYLEWHGSAYEIVRALLPRLRPNSTTVGKVCFVASEYPPYVFGGLGVHVTQLTAALGQHLQVDVILPSPNKETYHPPAPQVQLYPLAHVEASYDQPTSWLRFARFAAQKIINIADEFPPAVIHCHDWVTVLAGLKCRWYLDIPLVFHLHLPNRYPLCASVENLGLVCADLVTVNSEAMSAEVTDRHLTLRRPVVVVKNGVDLDMFYPGAEATVDEDYILFVGRLVEQKGVEYLLRAFYYISRKFPDVHLKIVGDGPLRPELETLCANLVLSHQVEFVGWKTGQELAGLYQQALVVVVPSIYEPFGMTALEGLACQRPVVASRVGGLKELIQHKVTGFLAEPRDELDLAQWLMTMLAQSELRHDIAWKGYLQVRNGGYTWPAVAQQFLKLYESLQGIVLDKAIPKEAGEFQQQILSVAGEMSPDLRNDENNLLSDVFNWMA